MATVTIAARSRINGKSYVVQYLDPDTGRKKYHATFRRRDIAQQEVNKLRIILDDGHLPETKRKRKERTGKTFGDVAELCRDEWQRRAQEGDLSPKTAEDYMIFLKPLLKHWEKELIATISEKDILDYRAALAERKSKVLSNRRMFIVKQVFGKAKKTGIIKEDPTAYIRYLSESEHERKRFMSPKEVAKLLNAATKTRAKHYLPLAILLAVEHGASKQEVLDLKWEDVSLDVGETGIIRFHRTKNNMNRVQRIMPRTYEALVRRRDFLALKRRTRDIKVIDDHVVGHLDGSRLGTFKAAWKQTCALIGLKDFHFHDNRHTFCSNIIRAGGSLKHAKEMIGHKTLRMTDRYSHLESGGENPIQDSLAVLYGATS
ncbi:MAG: site-specific integrase [Proteobacteria bacterium]|nr:site-specific integrase [Pseudomonadota bacterium]